MNIGADVIRRWHLNRGFRDIGYHYVIRRDGVVETGRPLEQVGAHAKPWNTGSIGICMVGGIDRRGKPESNFTVKQWAALPRQVRKLLNQYPGVSVIGHRDVPGVKKACPSFDVKTWLKTI